MNDVLKATVDRCIAEGAPVLVNQPLTKLEAAKKVADFLDRVTPADEKANGSTWKVYIYDEDGSRPLAGMVVSEVDFSNASGGGSYMQVDIPGGIAVCACAERLALAYIEDWGPEETPEEEYRLVASIWGYEKAESLLAQAQG